MRLRNELAPGTEGGITRIIPEGAETSIFEAAEHYAKDQVPLIVLAGQEYGSGSSRDWAAKGPKLLGIKAVIAESYERIHRSNLVGMGILPLQYMAGQTADSLGLTGQEAFSIAGITDLITLAAEKEGLGARREVTVVAADDDGVKTSFQALVRIDTPQEVAYFRHGGILQYVLRSLL